MSRTSLRRSSPPRSSPHAARRTHIGVAPGTLIRPAPSRLTSPARRQVGLSPGRRRRRRHRCGCREIRVEGIAHHRQAARDGGVIVCGWIWRRSEMVRGALAAHRGSARPLPTSPRIGGQHASSTSDQICSSSASNSAAKIAAEKSLYRCGPSTGAATSPPPATKTGGHYRALPAVPIAPCGARRVALASQIDDHHLSPLAVMT